jgi:transcriptional regulator with XRE-family HTH domain
MQKSNEHIAFIKAIGRILQEFRKNAGLSQTEIAKEIGLSETSGFKYISWLETGRINNPSLITVLEYLKACKTPWTKFFQKLSAIDFRFEHNKIMGQVEMPSNMTQEQRKKIDRDTALYLNKVQYPKTPFQKLDWERIKTKIDKKVKALLFNHQMDENAKQPYFNLTDELITNYDTGQIPAILKKHRQARILKYGIIEEIRKIVYQAVRTEQYRLRKQKALPSEKAKKMAGEFLRYRVKIEPIEAEVQKKLGELKVPIVHNQAYKNFIRESFQALKKYFHKDKLLLKQRFAEIIRTYKAQGLKEEVLLPLKDIILRYIELFESQK